MSAEQPVVESEASIESRLSAVFASEAGESEAAPEPQQQVSEEEPTNDEVQQEPEAEEAGEYIDFEADDGSTVKLPAAVKDAVLRQQDYTRKTMQLADLQKQAQDRLQYAEAREQLSAAVIEDVTELRAIERDIKQFEGLDWASLYQQDVGQAAALQHRYNELKSKAADKKAEIQGKAANFQASTQKHQSVQWQMAEEGARKLIGQITPAENNAMLKTIEGLGMTPTEFKARFADPRIIAAIHKAAKWDSLQTQKPAAVKAAQSAPPVVKPGASKGPSQAADKKYMDVRQSLKKSGSVEDAAKLFLLRGR